MFPVSLIVESVALDLDDRFDVFASTTKSMAK
jgi:hypothetical protein